MKRLFRSEQGFMLMTTVLMISMISLLVISQMRSIWLYSKLNNQVQASHDKRYALEAAAMSIRLLNQGPCVVNTIDLNQAIDQLLAKKACHWRDFGQDYLYLISYLGEYPCLQITSNNNVFSSEHWLVTVTIDEPHAIKQDLLQLRIATPSRQLACNGSKRSIHAGLISWRMMSAD